MSAITFNSSAPQDRQGRGLLGNIAYFFGKVADTTQRVKRVHVLHSLSDKELADRGLKREELVHYVYRDSPYV